MICGRMTPLLEAISRGDLICASHLLRLGADLTARTKHYFKAPPYHFLHARPLEGALAEDVSALEAATYVCGAAALRSLPNASALLELVLKHLQTLPSDLQSSALVRLHAFSVHL